jgi:hypothetical protein
VFFFFSSFWFEVFFCLKLIQLKSTFKLTKDCRLIWVWIYLLLYNNKKLAIPW